MNPFPTVTIQALGAMAALLLLAVFGWETAALALAGLVFAAGLCLDALYTRQQRTIAPEVRSASRRRSDRLMRCVYLLAGLLPVATAAGLHAARVADAPSPLVTTLLLIVSIAACLILISSIVDWFWILPRVTGLVRLPPWASPGDPAWRGVTSLWLFSRSVTALVLSLSAGAIPLVVAGATSGATRSAAYAIAGVLVAAALPSNNGLRMALNPPVSIGDLLQLEDGSALVVDISLQGAGFVWAERGPVRTSATGVPIKDGTVPLDELSWLSRLSPSQVSGGVVGAAPRSQEAVRRLEAVDPLGSMLNAEAAEREELQHRQSQQTGVGVALALVTTVLSVAAAAAQIAVNSRKSVTVVVVVVAAISVAAISRAALVVRTRQLARRQLRQSARLSRPLLELARQVGGQREALRAGLARQRHDRP